MAALKFLEPLHLVTGIGMPVTVRSVEHAYALLNDWPTWRRDAAHRVALRACRAALSGEIDVETARTMIRAFAERSNALAADDGAMAYPPLQASANVIELRP